jgi:hypothetical protein
LAFDDILPRVVPRSLRSWFIVHFVADMLSALPLFIAPREVLGWLGWNAVDPIATRLVAAALFGIGIESYLARSVVVADRGWTASGLGRVCDLCCLQRALGPLPRCDERPWPRLTPLTAQASTRSRSGTRDGRGGRTIGGRALRRCRSSRRRSRRPKRSGPPRGRHRGAGDGWGHRTV